MARTKHAARIAELHEQLVEALDELNTSRDKKPTTARASMQHESLLVTVWSLRFQVATFESIDESNPLKRQAFDNAALIASREIAEHEKRLVVARKSKDLDDEDEADEHEAEQAELAGRLVALAGGR
jgi:hypothetical protein